MSAPSPHSALSRKPYDPFGPVPPVQVDNSYDKAPLHLEAREGPTPAQWQAVKDEIRMLYEGRPLRNVKKILEQRHGFRATERMYKARLAEWGFTKDYSDKSYQICAVLHHAPEHSKGKATQSLYCGSPSKLIHHSRDTLLHRDERGHGTNEGQWPETWNQDSQDHARQDSSVRSLAIGLPRQATFRRQELENRERLTTYRCDYPGCSRYFVRQDLCVRHRERHTTHGSQLHKRDAFAQSTSNPNDDPAPAQHQLAQAPSYSMPAPAAKTPQQESRSVAMASVYLSCSDHPDCEVENITFCLECDWNKHMDKHERPYNCRFVRCEDSQGFNSPGRLLNHQKEVHPNRYASEARKGNLLAQCMARGEERGPPNNCDSIDVLWSNTSDSKSTSGLHTGTGFMNDPSMGKDRGDRLHPARRRGRGMRLNLAYWKDKTTVEEKDLFDDRECLFPDQNGRLVMPALANLDTQLKVPKGLVMSHRYAKEIGLHQDISTNFVDPCLRSISGHITPVTGILRNVRFRLKGTSVTFYRDFWICDALDSVVDIMVGASFIAENFKLLFDRFKSLCSTFAGWFSTKKETPEEKAKREEQERKQRLDAIKRERARLDNELALLEAAQVQGGQGDSLGSGTP
ncbi:hypothetical protein LTR10_011598 [Elasticomyces elasticus]|uniref:Metalloprotease n=1 Tax=Exophiala sideris TaxID=1016849 RepID=A0ABR0JD69_9EURO|nr:hypothetical protein LTR10_011598 [Elasticomyces elasticus]KAK5031943.1 metalloprotease [Exophiala sideris]KAK5040872.1 hypothetical protein LTR13_003173 [Exophiala sideris]KAK5061793.1 metalloprotease [Exophiala sideris]KAK5184493.1 metalloprotease [Eurotiomycetes sp. CCFEE 6388]